MSDIKNTPGGEHIDELLSQLKSIFGNLSETEEQEAKQKIGPPPVSPASTPTPPVTPPVEPPPTPPASDPILEPEPPSHEFSMPAPQMEEVGLNPTPPPSKPAPLPEPEPEPMPANAPIGVTPVESFVPSDITVPTGSSILPTAIFFPDGKIAEAKIVAEKVERITPKFTKVAFVLNVQMLNSFNQRSDWKEAVLSQLQGSPVKTVLIMLDKPMEESRRKALQAALEPRGIYVQEVLLNQIEKKALYTDMLLGMVFFFDSRKPTPPETAA